ncbi:uncharacterized protein LOC124165368 [Ischnura elegans]|uniref:uncharacterized protein LOC124165368 n=1 Tax=Ischnura elegans TaxID=197161 RepID=UPI001ED888C6|nr:uncharacterized protein LOC124165368 [Ischnura elegans]
MGPLDHCALPHSPHPPLMLLFALFCASSPVAPHPTTPAVLAPVDIPLARRRRLAKADHIQGTALPETKAHVFKETALCPPTGPPPTVSSAVPLALKGMLSVRTTARTPPSFTPLLPGLIAGGVGITLLPPRPWIPEDLDPKRGDRYNPTPPATTTPDPHLEEGNVTGRLGSVAYLDCRVEDQPDTMVTWLQRRDDSIQLLTVGREPYSEDSRFLLSHEDPNNWRLQILPVMKDDEGLYECQIATQPIKVKRVYLQVTAPELKIVDEDRNELLERHYKAGSEVKLTCLATQLQEEDGAADDVDAATEEGRDVHSGAEHDLRSTALQGVARKILWRHGGSRIVRSTVDKTIRPTSSADGRNASVVLTIHDIKAEDEGNYTCSLGEASSEAVRIKIIRGQDSRSNGAGHIAHASVIEKCMILYIIIMPLSALTNKITDHLMEANILS